MRLCGGSANLGTGFGERAHLVDSEESDADATHLKDELLVIETFWSYVEDLESSVLDALLRLSQFLMRHEVGKRRKANE